MIYELTNAYNHLVAVGDEMSLSPQLVKEKLQNKKKSLLIMKADYCGHCHNLLKTLQDKAFDNEVIFVMDQADPVNKKIMEVWRVQGYPTIYQVDKNGHIDVDHEYGGARDIGSLKKLF